MQPIHNILKVSPPLRVYRYHSNTLEALQRQHVIEQSSSTFNRNVSFIEPAMYRVGMSTISRTIARWVSGKIHGDDNPRFIKSELEKLEEERETREKHEE
ncbi:hypothetical protein E8E12_010883 [Didymella heteroderae]|uniref:Uncharacterized protein n=1 Tax=Didymella heteroderae TaxID=1769908 RepID=A0A9P4X0H7_9PLEO|nr:hypothetical protein E8E12_010883 [Didymella heteroderae]